MRINTIIRGVILAAAIGLISACATPPKNLPAFRESRPRSILIMPPVNQSMDVNSVATFLSTSTIPLAESGYYVIPVALSDETFKQNGITVAEEAHAIDFHRLYEIFGADAALYITITQFGSIYRVIKSTVEAAASAKLVDLKTGQELWSGSVFAKDEGNTSSNSLLLSLVGAVVDQVAHNISNKSHDVGKEANYHLLSADNSSGILFGPYHPKFGTD